MSTTFKGCLVAGFLEFIYYLNKFEQILLFKLNISRFYLKFLVIIKTPKVFFGFMFALKSLSIPVTNTVIRLKSILEFLHNRDFIQIIF